VVEGLEAGAAVAVDLGVEPVLVIATAAAIARATATAQVAAGAAGAVAKAVSNAHKRAVVKTKKALAIASAASRGKRALQSLKIMVTVQALKATVTNRLAVVKKALRALGRRVVPTSRHLSLKTSLGHAPVVAP
jgi:hypothetical protein